MPVGLLKADRVMVFNTSNTFEDREKAIFGDPLERIWKDCIFNLCGVKETHRQTFGVIITSTDKERDAWLSEVHKKVDGYYPADK